MLFIFFLLSFCLRFDQVSNNGTENLTFCSLNRILLLTSLSFSYLQSMLKISKGVLLSQTPFLFAFASVLRKDSRPVAIPMLSTSGSKLDDMFLS